MFGPDDAHISRPWKSWLLHLSLNISEVWTLSGDLPLEDIYFYFFWGERQGIRKKAPEGYLLCRYKDKDTKCITHMLDLQESLVEKKCNTLRVFEVEKNTIARVNEYTKQYVSRRNGGSGGAYGAGGGAGRSWPCICIYIHLCWNKNEHRQSHVSCVPKGVDDAGEKGPLFFILIVEKDWLRGTTGPIFF